MKSVVNSRTFAAMVIAACLSMCSMSHATETQLTTDVVVVGGGAAGMSASVSAAQHGAKVILLEKESTLGGAARYAEGLFAVETDELRKKASPLTKDYAFKKAMEFNHWEADAALVHKVIDESPNTIAWLDSLGLQFDPTSISPDEPPTWHLVQDYKGIHHGAALIACLKDHADELGVKIMVSTPATNLILENGKILGVEATDKDGNKIAIHAKAVVLGTGGFPASRDMIAKYTQFDPNKVFGTAPLHKNGDGINMALSAGGEIDKKMGLMVHPGAVGNGVMPMGSIFAMSWQPTLWVNKYGDRFMDESKAFDFSMAGNAIYQQRDSIAWAIWDDTVQKHVMENGIDNGVGVLIPIGTKLTSLPKEETRAAEKKSTVFYTADSVEELAKKMGMEPARLKATVDHYNAIQTNGHDDAFAKEPRYAVPVKNGHLYALRLVPMYFTSIGGVKVDTDFRALNPKDQPIPGLYIAGSDMGGNYGDTYTLWTSGYAFGLASTSGRVTGAEAAEFVKLQK
jgi:fumarate reductase flavoprotein subunit